MQGTESTTYDLPGNVSLVSVGTGDPEHLPGKCDNTGRILFALGVGTSRWSPDSLRGCETSTTIPGRVVDGNSGTVNDDESELELKTESSRG